MVEVLLETTRKILALQILLAGALEREGSNLAGMGENEDGLKSLLHAADLARRAVRAGTPVGKAPETLSEILWQQARLYRAPARPVKLCFWIKSDLLSGRKRVPAILWTWPPLWPPGQV